MEKYFNSHAHVERDPTIENDNHRSMDFNSHAHVERDYRATALKITHNISTHTLTWSVTGVYSKFKTLGAISTHTLTWSVTQAD